MDYSQLREVLVNTESLYNLWKSTGLDEDQFIRANRGLIEQSEKTRLQKDRAKARQIKFLDKQKASGKRFLSALVSSETYDRLCRERDRSIQAGSPKNLGEILDQLLSGSKPDQKRPIVETQNEITQPDQAPAQTDAIDQNDPKQNPPDQAPAQTAPRDVIKIMAAHRKAEKTWPAIATALNDKKLFTGTGKKWTPANALTFFNRKHKS